MSVFKDGTNRSRVYKTLSSDEARTAASISKATGLSERDVKEVLSQIRRLGHTLNKDLPDGTAGWIKGDGSPYTPVKGKAVKGQITKKPQTGVGKKVKEYLLARIGHQVTMTGIVGDLKLNSSAYPLAIVTDFVKQGYMSRIGTAKPHTWMINPSMSEPQQTSLMMPAPQPQADLMPHAPDLMQTSAAISTLMQTENKNIVYRQALTQIIGVYEQLGNILEMIGNMED